VFRIPSGINDQNTLNKIAQHVYESIGRQELSLECTTKNLGSFGGDNLDPDVLDMKVGDPFELAVNRDTDNVNDLTYMETMLTAQGTAAAMLVRLGFSAGFAGAYATAYTNANFLTVYRLKSLKIDWNADSGVTLDVHGCNYIEIRANKLLPPGQETTSSPLQPATPPPLPPVTTGSQ
jgi:hypothetical protein